MLPFTSGGPVTTGDGRAPTVAVPWAVVDAPSTSVIAIVVEYVPTLAYVCGPVTTKPPPGLADTTPGVAVPSPQVTVALKSETLPNGLASVNVATGPVKLTPAIGLTEPPADAERCVDDLDVEPRLAGWPSLFTKLIRPW